MVADTNFGAETTFDGAICSTSKVENNMMLSEMRAKYYNASVGYLIEDKVINPKMTG